MTVTAANPPIAPAAQRNLVLLLGLMAAVRVLVFSAAFPLFNSMDEQLHFDLMVRYSRGDMPRAMETTCAEARHDIIFYETLEYLWPPDVFPKGEIPPPLWTQPWEKAGPRLSADQTLFARLKNPEDSQPPIYYLLAGVWWRLNQACGWHPVWLLYSARFLNAIFIAALVWTGFAAARLVFPGAWFPQISVPALLAFFPQTSFYTVSNDVLSPLGFGVAFILLVKLMTAARPGVGLGSLGGLALAATFLIKSSNLPLLAVALAAILIKTAQWAKGGKLRDAFPALAALAGCASPPIIAWLAWCKHWFGDYTGSAQKIQLLGWTTKPFAEWWRHPIFTWPGLQTFLSDLMATFWQGEVLWHRQPLSWLWTDRVYGAASLVLLLFALLQLGRPCAAVQRQALWLGFGCLAAAVLFLGFLSIIYDFHDCFYPSRAYPYFASGRLMLGALLPFALLLVCGLDNLLKPLGDATKYAVLTLMLLFMLATEITLDWPVFQNPYNLFHLGMSVAPP
jgi:hypothetical protein